MPKQIPVEIDGKKYSKITAAAEAYNIAPYMVYRRLKRGWTIEQALKIPRDVSTLQGIFVEGVEYPTFLAVAKAYNIRVGTVRMRLKLGWSDDDALLGDLNEHEKPIEVDGTKYPSISSAADAYDVSVSTVYWRLKAGWSIEAALKTPPTKIVERNGREIEIRVKGVSYRSISEAARAHDLRIGTVMWRLKHGWTPEEAAGIAERKRPKRK